MSTRDFEDGMVAGAKPFETKFSQQASDIRKIRKDMEKWCDRYGSLVDVVLDDLGDQEKQRIYRIQTKLDPANMGESEQELLVCILYTVARHTETTDTERNCLRQKFLGGVQNYLGIASPQSMKEISDLQEPIENVDRKSEEKTILQVLSEYLYLTYGNYVFLDQSQIVSYFAAVATSNFLDEIRESIDEQFRAVGPEGLAAKYQDLKVAKSAEVETEKSPKLRIYVEMPQMGKKKDPQTEEESKCAKELKAQLQNNGYPRLDRPGDVDFCVYYPTSPDADSIREAFENDFSVRPLYSQYGCEIYCKGSNIFLNYALPENMSDALREGIVELYGRYSTRAFAPEILKWEEDHKSKEKEKYLAYKANALVDSAAQSVKRVAQKGMHTEDKRFPIAVGKKAGGTVLRGIQAAGTRGAKVVLKAGNLVETAEDKMSVKSINVQFDKKILPRIQRDLLMFKLLELLENGTITTE